MCATGVIKSSGVAACTTRSGLRLEPTRRSRWSWFGLVLHGGLYGGWVPPQSLFAVQGIRSNFPLCHLHPVKLVLLNTEVLPRYAVTILS